MTVCHWVSAYWCFKRTQCLLFQGQIAWPWKQRHGDQSKRQELLLHWQCVISQKTWILIWHSEDRASWYILIIKANKMHYFSNLFILVKNSACFGQIYCPSSGVSQHCICSNWYLSYWLCWLSASEVRIELHPDLASRQPTELAWQMPIAVYTVLRYSWWWTVDLSETCRVKLKVKHSRNRPLRPRRV